MLVICLSNFVATVLLRTVETKERVKILLAKVNLSHKSAKTITITLARFISKSVVSLSCILSEHHTNAMSLYFVVVLNICTFKMKYNCLSHDVKSLRICGIQIK